MSPSSQSKQAIDLIGSTGSIGENVLRVVREYPERLSVASLAAGHNWQRLVEQVNEFNPEIVALADPSCEGKLRGALPDFNGRIVTGKSAAAECVTESNGGTAVIATVGFTGVHPTLHAIGRRKRICLANKETLVAAGPVVMPQIRESGVTLAPIDSEHSAIWQCLRAGRHSEIHRIWLTASGGPFRRRDLRTFDSITVEEALAHPTWNMGTKITIDSATMMNKAFEIIEAVWLFAVDHLQVEVVIHPQSTIHSMVEFDDGSTIAQLGSPDMKVPIRTALFAPERVETADSQSRAFSPLQIAALEFEPPDDAKFPALRLARQVAETGGTAGAVFNGADEAAVAAFLNRQIRFPRVTELIEQVLNEHEFASRPTLDDIVAADQWAKERVQSLVHNRAVAVN